MNRILMERVCPVVHGQLTILMNKLEELPHRMVKCSIKIKLVKIHN